MGNGHSSVENQNSEEVDVLLRGLKRQGQGPLTKESSTNATKTPASVPERRLFESNSEKANAVDPSAYDETTFLFTDLESLDNELAILKSACGSHSKTIAELHDAVFQSAGEPGWSSRHGGLLYAILDVKVDINSLETCLSRVRPALTPGHQQNLLQDANKFARELRSLRDSVDGYAAELKKLVLGPRRCVVKDQRRALEEMSEKRDFLEEQCRETIRAIYAFRITFDENLSASG